MLKHCKNLQTSSSMKDIRFLLIEEVIEIHRLQINRFGGLHGVRDRGLLESAIMSPQASFAGYFAYDSLALMAAAYVFHLIKNHPFHDGNKRAGVLTGLIFLRRNGIHAQWSQQQMVDLGIQVALSELRVEEIAELPFFASESS